MALGDHVLGAGLLMVPRGTSPLAALVVVWLGDVVIAGFALWLAFAVASWVGW